MRLTRIFTPGPLQIGLPIQLTAAGANHVARALRAKPGDGIILFDGEGREFQGTIASIAAKSVSVMVTEALANTTESALSIELIQGISRGERMDWVVQKATELGVSSIVPVVTARSVVKLDDEKAAKRREHWQNIVISACEQCGRSRLPELTVPQTLQKFLDRPAKTTRIVLDPLATQSISDLLPEKKVQILIGPEGGLDDDELGAAKSAGFTAVKLGPRILRTETAAVVAIALLQGKWGDLA